MRSQSADDLELECQSLGLGPSNQHCGRKGSNPGVGVQVQEPGLPAIRKDSEVCLSRENSSIGHSRSR